MDALKKIRILHSNALKFLAAIFMLFDHIGLLFFPTQIWWRIVGRLSMPLFAFAIAEGCRYTRDKVKHFALLFGLGAICQIVYYLYDGSLYFSILITFSLSVLNIYALQYAKKKCFESEKLAQRIPALLLFLFMVALTACICNLPYCTVDYGFWGCMLPVFASLFDFRGIEVGEKLRKFDCLPVRVLCMGIGLLAMCIALERQASIIYYALFTIPLLLLYNGEKGKVNAKYFFYIFYPLHLVVLQGIYILLYLL